MTVTIPPADQVEDRLARLAEGARQILAPKEELGETERANLITLQSNIELAERIATRRAGTEKLAKGRYLDLMIKALKQELEIEAETELDTLIALMAIVHEMISGRVTEESEYRLRHFLAARQQKRVAS